MEGGDELGGMGGLRCDSLQAGGNQCLADKRSAT